MTRLSACARERGCVSPTKTFSYEKGRFVQVTQSGLIQIIRFKELREKSLVNFKSVLGLAVVGFLFILDINRERKEN